MRLLILTPQLPYPPRQGASIRNFGIISELAKRHDVHLLSFLEPDQDTKEAAPLVEMCRSVQVVPPPERRTGVRFSQFIRTDLPDMLLRLNSAEFHRMMKKTLEEHRFDVVQVEGIEMAPYLTRVFAMPPDRPRPLTVYDAHNAEWLLQKRAFLADLRSPLRWPAAYYSVVQYRRLQIYEGNICRKLDRVVAVSEADAVAIGRVARGVRINVIPNGVDLEFHAGYEGKSIPHDLVFTGKMDFRANVDAILWFARKVFPLVRKKRPDTTLAVVGQRPHRRLEPLRKIEGITITGSVDDVRPYIAGAGVYVAPLRVGGGTRLKLLQAMAMQKGIVSTTVGAEGFPVTSGRELVLADSPRDFADAVLSLLENPARCRELGRTALDFVRENYVWEKLVPRFERLYSQTEG